MVTARTAIGGFLPGLRRRQVRRPKRKGATLERSRFVDFTCSPIAVEENAIAVWKFDQAFPNTHLPHVLCFKFNNADFEQCGQRLDFGLVDPDMARGARATITASGAFEFQSLMIPGFLGHIQVTNNSSALALRSLSISGIR